MKTCRYVYRSTMIVSRLVFTFSCSKSSTQFDPLWSGSPRDSHGSALRHLGGGTVPACANQQISTYALEFYSYTITLPALVGKVRSALSFVMMPAPRIDVLRSQPPYFEMLISTTLGVADMSVSCCQRVLIEPAEPPAGTARVPVRVHERVRRPLFDMRHRYGGRCQEERQVGLASLVVPYPALPGHS